MLICIEGIDGAGKTTVAAAVRAELEGKTGRDVTVVPQPSHDGPGGEFRELARHDLGESPLLEVVLLVADRAYTDAAVVRPALEAGKVVILDRYYFSHVYQAVSGLDLDQLLAASSRCFPEPDLSVWLDVPVHVARGRAKERHDEVGLERAEALHDLYANLALQGHTTRFDGTLPVADIASQIVQLVLPSMR